MMLVYKGFDKNLECRGYKFKANQLNVTDNANCRTNGFHAAENPLDCLSYYSDMDRSVYWLCSASGDIDEDGEDSKIYCTELTLIKELSLAELVNESLKYMQAHPLREWNDRVKSETAIAECKFAIARGKNPVAMGKVGTVIGLAKEYAGCSKIMAIAFFEVDGEKIKSDVWYDVFGKAIEEDRL